MQFESDSLRLTGLKIAGAEAFDTGNPERLFGVWDCPSVTPDGLTIPVKLRKPEIGCRESDIALHRLVKDSPIRRVSDDKQYSVRDFDYDGTGLAVIFLKG